MPILTRQQLDDMLGISPEKRKQLDEADARRHERAAQSYARARASKKTRKPKAEYGLPEDQKAHIIAQYNGGAEARDIATDTGLSLPTVQQTIAHARKKGLVARFSYPGAASRNRTMVAQPRHSVSSSSHPSSVEVVNV